MLWPHVAEFNDGNGIGMAIPKWPKKSNVVNPIMTGWWFGTCFFFPYIGSNNPKWLSYFSEGLKPPTRWTIPLANHFAGVYPIIKPLLRTEELLALPPPFWAYPKVATINPYASPLEFTRSRLMVCMKIWNHPSVSIHYYIYYLWLRTYIYIYIDTMILYKYIYIYYLQCEAPKIAKLVYNSNNYGLWYL